MESFRNAWGWLGGHESKDGNKVQGGAEVGGSTLHGKSSANDLLGGLVGGFGSPMDWKGAGFGGMADAKVSNKDGEYLGGKAGFGAGVGYSTFSGDENGYKTNGGALAGGYVVPVGLEAGNKDVQASASTNFYKAGGVSGYGFNDGKGDSGYGAKGSYVPMGMMDTNLGLKTDYFDANAHADNMYLNKIGGEAKFGEKNGTYYGDVSGYQKMGIEGYKGSLDTGIGKFGSQAGSVTYGTQVGGGASYDSKTGAAELRGNYQDGVEAKNLGIGYNSPGGAVSTGVDVGQVNYGNRAQGKMNWDPAKGQFTADGSYRGGGVQVQDIKSHTKIDGVIDHNVSLGEFSNDLKIDDAHFEADRKHTRVGASVDGGGLRFQNGKLDTTFGSGPNAVNVNAGVGSLGSGDSITKAYAEANYESLDKLSLKAGFDELSYGGWSGKDIHAGFKGPGGIEGKAGVGEFSQGLLAKDFHAGLDKNGLTAKLGHADYSSTTVKDANLDFKLGNAYSSNAKLGELGLNKAMVDQAEAGLTWDKGLYASAKEASYDSVYLKGLSADQAIGGDLYKSHLGLGEGSYNSFYGKNMSAGIDSTGMKAHLEDGKYRYLAGKDIEADISLAGGAVGLGVGAKEASVGGVDIGKLDYKSDFRNTDLSVQNLGAHGFKSKDIYGKANVGDLGLGLGAKELNMLDLKVGSAEAHTKNFGLEGNAAVKDAQLDALNIKGGHAGLSWGGKEALGITGDYRSGAGVKSADANWDVLGGTANAKFQDANFGSQMNNAHLNLFGTDLALPDAGFKVNASGGANVDLSRGAASANLGLGGTSVNFGGYEATVPEWVQAQAGVDLSRGAVNAQLGGANGVGADISLADGNMDLNAFGYTLDVDEGIRSAGRGIASGASAVGGAISDGASAVGGAFSNGASMLYNALPSISLPSFSMPSW